MAVLTGAAAAVASLLEELLGGGRGWRCGGKEATSGRGSW